MPHFIRSFLLLASAVLFVGIATMRRCAAASFAEHIDLSHDSVSYSLDGAMSGPLVIGIDLTDGTATLQEPNPTNPQSGAVVSHRPLSASQLREVRDLAATAFSAGLENPRCVGARAHGEIIPPIMDALLQMHVTLNGQTAEAPVRPDCWSAAAETLRAAMYKAVH